MGGGEGDLLFVEAAEASIGKKCGPSPHHRAEVRGGTLADPLAEPSFDPPSHGGRLLMLELAPHLVLLVFCPRRLIPRRLMAPPEPPKLQKKKTSV